MIRLLRALVVLVLAVAVVTFAVANRTSVPVSFWPFPWELQVPLYAVLLAGVVVGALLAALVAGVELVRLSFEVMRLRRRLARYEREERLREEAREEALIERLRRAPARGEAVPAMPAPRATGALPAS